jgi:hypothetical protein
MKVKFESDRLQIIPKEEAGSYEERFIKELTRLIQAVSNELMAWYGDVEFDGKETSGYVITWKPKRNPRKLSVESQN